MATKDKIAALVLNLPQAPAVWHTVEGVAGLVHPDIPVPHQGAEAYLDAHAEQLKRARKEWDALEAKMEKDGWRMNGKQPFVEPDCPVELVWVTEKQAQEGADAHEAARHESIAKLRAARRSGDDVERTLAHNEAAALSGETKE